MSMTEAATINPFWTCMVTTFLERLPLHKIVFAHDDIAPRNKHVRGTKVIGIVDREHVGFYPEYWEYVKAYYWADSNSG